MIIQEALFLRHRINMPRTYPCFREESALLRKGYKIIAGLDEAGRGPLAGPVIAVAVIINPKFKFFKGVKDSKQLSAKKREEIYEAIKKCPFIKWGIGRVSEKVIDKINILEATKLAMEKAVKSLKKKAKKIDFLILDGNFSIDVGISQKSVIKGDEKVFSCASASIIAKVERDRIMGKYHKKYPQYGFPKHKGYPTKYHKEMIRRYGLCQIHRKTFKFD